MKSTVENNTLTVFLEGRIDANSAPSLEKEILELADANPGAGIVIDAESLEYISSAGLRVLMNLQKKKGDLSIINVSLEVYEIFEVTGFTEILDVQKRLRFLSSEGLEKMGSGVNGTVYRLDDENILKTVKNMTLEAIRDEMDVSKMALIYGIPTAIAFDVVKTEEGYGEVYEMVKAGVLAAAIMAEPEKKDYYLDEFVRVYREIHSVDVSDSKFTPLKDRYLDAADGMRKYMTSEENEAIKKFINAIPDKTTFIHGDYHLGNIMLQDGELMLIDIGEAGYGNPLFDLAQTRLAYYYSTVIEPKRATAITGLSLEMAQWFADNVFNRYLGTEGEVLENQMKIVHIMGLLRAIFVAYMQGREPREESVKERVKELQSVLFADVDGMCSLVSELFA